MNIKNDFTIEVIPLFKFNNFSEIRQFYRESKQLTFNIILTNKKTNKIANINYSMGCGFLDLKDNNYSFACVSRNNKIKPSDDDIIESIELDIDCINDYTMGEFIEEFGYNPSKGIDIYNACVAEYNSLKNTYSN